MAPLSTPVVLCALALLMPTASNEVPSQVMSNWATRFGMLIAQICRQNTSRDAILQAYQDKATIKTVDGIELVKKMAMDMAKMMKAKTDAVKRIVGTAEAAAESHATVPDLRVEYFNAKKLNEYENIGNNTLKPGYREFRLGSSSKHYSGIPVNMTRSTVHVPTNVFDKSTEVMNAIQWSEKLDRTFVTNYLGDPAMSWQYFGSATGLMRQFPGVKWLVDESEPDLYDARMREWYIRAASSPKDIIILLDLSGSMTGLRLEIAKYVVLNILDTLNSNDYVNIYNFSAQATPLYPCFADTLVQANLENIRIFKTALDGVRTQDVANFTKALTKAFESLKEFRTTRRGAMCNQAIMLVTDGAPENFEHIFQQFNRPRIRVRVFSYLIGRDVTDREAVEWMACENQGYFTHVTTLAEVREQVQKYIPVLARPWVLSRNLTDNPVIWTGVYADIADPKLTDWLWEIRERARQYQRSKNYQKVLRDSAGPEEQLGDRLDNQCYDEMENFLTYGVRKLNRTERERMEAQRYLETKLDIRETSISDKWTLYIGRTGSEATRHGYRLMTSVSMPVYDNNEIRKKVARLLGVVGTDVLLSDIQKHAPPYNLGVNGYSFMIDNNGHVLYHPDLRPVHRKATKQFQEILKPNYNTVDLIDVEIGESDIPRDNNTELDWLRTSMIDGEKAQTKMMNMKQHLDNMKRIVKRRQRYFFHPVNATPFSLGIALPDRYGKMRISGQVELTQAARSNLPVRKYFEGPNWSVHPDWVYCEYDSQADNDAHSLDTPEAQYMHFLNMIMDTQSFVWRSERIYPVPEVKESSGSGYKSNTKKFGTYFCDRDLFQSVVFDARATLSFEAEPSSPRGLYEQLGVAHSFVATRSGFTRWKTHWPSDMHNADELKFRGVRAIDEVWYKRAVDFNWRRPSESAVVFSVPFDAGQRNESLVTGAHAIFLRKANSRSPTAVVGIQFLLSKFRDMFLINTTNCDPDALDCYLLDDSGFVLVSKRHEETGRFFGDVDGTVLDALLEHMVYQRVTMYDYQGVCLDVVSTGSSSWTLMTPVRYVRWLVGWAGGQLLWLLVRSSLLHLVSANLAWAAERAVYDAASQDGGFVGADHMPVDEENCVRVSNDHLFRMAHINKTRPRPCDKKVNLYTLSPNATSVNGTFTYCNGVGGNTCNKSFALQKVPETNMVMLVVDALCPCDRKTISITLEEQAYPDSNGSECARLRFERYRRLPQGCEFYHSLEEGIDICGRSAATGQLPALAAGWHSLLAVLSAIWLTT